MSRPELLAYFGARAPFDDGLRHVDGTHRCRPIAETLASIGGRLRDLGISRVIDLTPLDRIGLPVFNFCLPNVRTESYAAGKGLTREACLVSGLMEALEIRCAIARHPRHEALARRRDELAPLGEAIDPSTLPLPVRPDLAGDECLDWFRCLELGTGREVYLPADLFGFVYGKSPGVSRATAYLSTNGTASGNSVHEAILHALYELVERDASVLANFGAPRGLALERDTLPPALAQLCARIEDAGVELYVLDVSSDVGLPVYQAYLVEQCGFAAYHRHQGFGCHHDPRVALARAITEACQVRLTYFAGAREDVADPVVGEDAYRALLRYRDGAIGVSLPASPQPLDLAAALDMVLARLSAIGCDEVYVADLSLPEFEQAVVGCYVPGLEGPHYDAAGRLAVGARGWSHRMHHGARRFGF